MANNVLKTLSKNLGFKILAVVFAFTLWLTVYNLEDPTKTKALTINVSVTNVEAVETLNKYYEIIEGTNKVSFSVTAARSILDKLDESDFLAVANMEHLVIDEEEGTGTIPIEIVCTANVNSNSIKLSSTNKLLKVALEDLMSKQFVVQASATGEVADGYALGEVTVTAPNVLKVSGPKSIVEDIAAVVATIDVSGMSDTWTSYKVTPVLYDQEGKEIDTTRLTLSSSTVNVSAEILKTKDVPVSVKPEGTPEEGYAVTTIKTNPQTIKLKGNSGVLNSINAIEIPASLISVAGASSDVVATIDVSEYIPEGATLVNAEQANVKVTVSIGKIKEKVFSVSSENIIVSGLQTGAKLGFEVSSVAVTISGLEEDINNLSNEMLNGSIDVTNLSVGTHQVKLVLDLDASKYTYSDIYITVVIEKEETSDEGQVPDEEDSEQGESESEEQPQDGDNQEGNDDVAGEE